MRTIDVAPLPLSDLESHLDEVAARRLHDGVEAAHALLDSRTVWTITPSAAASSGPAETVAPLVGYARGLGIDARWLALDAPAEFVTLATRLNDFLHGTSGDGGKLGDKQRDLYEHVLASNADNVIEDVREGDVVILHDPATAGLTEAFTRAGATVLWRLHAGVADAGEAGQHAWAFLDGYLEEADLIIASRPEYLPPYVEEERTAVIAPSVNPDSPKNRVLDLDEARSVVRLAGYVAGQAPFDAVPFIREDGRPDAFRGLAEEDAFGLDAPVPEGARTITQVQRWDRLKGGKELLDAFAAHIGVLPADAHLVIAGPVPDPEREPAAVAVLEEIMERLATLPESTAARVHLLGIPSTDREVNATIVNALQRVSTVVTQRSLVEAFGLTVAEAMWKKAPVVASAVGGIQEQVEDGVTGSLVPADDDLAWATAAADLLLFTERAQEMGDAAHEAVRRRYLPDRHLIEVVDAIARALG
ncbi:MULTISPECIES: glycosyltransferase [unclassified Actinomyces]|uniref:glycosyltransferase n=2 Tax=Actinomyces TaxID=1654 RepID=UPI002016E376|nr:MULTISPECIES: glycosyltransferase [unclassified Actinomyces]MCL3777761.1 glycosyltransferase [Actinomyces sp. AC-20-1]MCL3789477.1 glycosyltransferase [Actinomyces sp. 187325]MCL3791780.1 glycosyltransferase [Actinomyces sp. 186855]MCL3794919.1 glycosyltransferase [Actinomyces sp. 217892]